jgi:hypothetical protein
MQLAAEILIRDKTKQGADAAAAGFKKVGKAADGAADISERNVKASKSLEKEYGRLQKKLNPIAGATARLAKEESTLERARASGLITQREYNEQLEKARRNFTRYKDKVEDAEKAQRKLERSSSGLGKALGGVNKKILAMGAGAASLALGAVGVNQFFDAIDRAEDISDRSFRLGVSTEDLQALREIGDRNGASFQLIDDTLKEMNVKVGEFIELGTGEAANVLPALFTEAEIAALKAADSVERYVTIGTRIGELEDPAKRAAAANKLLGGSGTELLNTFAKLADDGFGKLKGEMLEAGAIIEDDLIQQGAEASVVWRTFRRELGTRIDSALLENADNLIALADSAGYAAEKFIEAAGGMGQFLQGIEQLGRNVALGYEEGDIDEARGRLAELEGDLQDAQRLVQMVNDDIIRGQNDGLQLFPELDEALLEERAQKVFNILEKIQVVRADIARQEGIAEQRRKSLVQGIQTEGDAVPIEVSVDFDIDGALKEIEDKFRRLDEADLDPRETVARIAALMREVEAVKVAAAEAGVFVNDATFEALTRSLDDMAGGVRKAADEAAAAFREAFNSKGNEIELNLGNIEREVAALEAGGLAALERMREVIALEEERKRIIEAAGKAGLTLTQAEVDARIEEIDQLNQAKRGRDQLIKQYQEAGSIAERSIGREATDDFGDRMTRVAEDFSDILSEGGERFAGELGEALIRESENLFREGSFGNGSFFDFLRGINGDIPNTDRVVGQAAPGADPNAQRSRALFYAGSALNIAQGFEDGGVSGGLDALAGSLAAVSPEFALAIAGGKIGLTAANLIDGNGANETTASVGQFFGIVGGLIAGLVSKASSDGARITVDPVTGRFTDRFRKDSEGGLENLSALEQFAGAFAGTLDQLQGGLLGDLSFGDLDFRFQLDNRDGFTVGRPGSDHSFGPDRVQFDSANEALAFAVQQAVSQSSGGDEELIAILNRGLLNGYEVEDAVGVVESFKNLRALVRPDVSPFEQAAEELARQGRLLQAQFEDIGASTERLQDVFSRAAQALADDVDDASRQSILQRENPQLAQIRDLLEAQLEERRAAAAAMSVGGVVDLGLQNEAQRGEILDVFGDLEARLALALDPVGAAFDLYLEEQAKELAALASSVDGVRITQADVELLQRVQAAERQQYFNNLSPEDRLEFAERYSDELEDLGGDIELVLLQISEAVSGGLESFEQVRADAEDRLRSAENFLSSAQSAALSFDRRYGEGIPERRLDELRATAEDLAARALAGDEAARGEVFSAIDEFAALSRELGGSGAAFQADRTLSRDLIQDLVDAGLEEVSDAQRALDLQVEERDLLREIRDLLAEPDIDQAAILAIADAVTDEDLATALRDYIGLLNSQAGQGDAVAAILERLAAQFGIDIDTVDLSDLFDDPREDVDLLDTGGLTNTPAPGGAGPSDPSPSPPAPTLGPGAPAVPDPVLVEPETPLGPGGGPENPGASQGTLDALTKDDADAMIAATLTVAKKVDALTMATTSGQQAITDELVTQTPKLTEIANGGKQIV